MLPSNIILFPCYIVLISEMYLERQAPPPKPKVEDGIFGTSGGIGFTKENELFVGRVAMLGFAVSTLINGHAHFFFIWHLQCVD
jgi:hypothetical protein